MCVIYYIYKLIPYLLCDTSVYQKLILYVYICVCKREKDEKTDFPNSRLCKGLAAVHGETSEKGNKSERTIFFFFLIQQRPIPVNFFFSL